MLEGSGDSGGRIAPGPIERPRPPRRGIGCMDDPRISGRITCCGSFNLMTFNVPLAGSGLPLRVVVAILNSMGFSVVNHFCVVKSACIATYPAETEDSALRVSPVVSVTSALI